MLPPSEHSSKCCTPQPGAGSPNPVRTRTRPALQDLLQQSSALATARRRAKHGIAPLPSLPSMASLAADDATPRAGREKITGRPVWFRYQLFDGAAPPRRAPSLRAPAPRPPRRWSPPGGTTAGPIRRHRGRAGCRRSHGPPDAPLPKRAPPQPNPQWTSTRTPAKWSSTCSSRRRGRRRRARIRGTRRSRSWTRTSLRSRTICRPEADRRSRSGKPPGRGRGRCGRGGRGGADCGLRAVSADRCADRNRGPHPQQGCNLCPTHASRRLTRSTSAASARAWRAGAAAGGG